MRQDHYVSFYVYKRPFLDFFLYQVTEWFDVVIFTAGEKIYADSVINAIDPYGRIKKRLYKSDCSIEEGHVRKRVITVTPQVTSAMILDNNPECYCMDKSNAISITSWYGDARDKELLNLLPFLYLMRVVENVQTVLNLNH